MAVTFADMTTGRPTPSVREEAHPLTADELTEQQRDAVIDTVGRLRRLALRASSAAPVRTERTRFLVHIDAERSNHVLMIEGARGSGKTSAMVTLLHVLLKLLEKERPGIGDLEVDPSISILPLPILDVRPLPKDVALLPMLLGSFQGVVESLPESEASAKPGQFRPQNTSRALFERMMQAATIGWSVPAARALSGEAVIADLDMRKMDRLRRDLLPAFHAFMQQLEKDVEQAHGYRRPFFVIPVDDLDMNPGRTPEMLDLLRTLAHPRLAFVVTADRALMKATMLHEFMRELNPTRILESGTVEAATALAAAHVSKIAPEENSSALTELSDVGARGLFLASLDGIGTEINIEFENVSVHPWAWSALPRHPRPVHELAALVRGVTNYASILGRAVVGLGWDREVERHEYGYFGWRERLRGRISLEGQRLQVDGALFTPRGRTEIPLTFHCGELAFEVAIRMRWEVIARGVGTSEVLDVGDASQPSAFAARPNILLPRTLSNMVMVAMSEHDGDPAVAATFVAGLADAPHVTVTHLDRPGGFPLRLRWPTPAWASVLQTQKFTVMFESGAGLLVQSSSTDEKRATLVRLFLRAIVYALLPKDAVDLSRNLDVRTAITALRKSSSEVARVFVREKLHLLATPEAGLSSVDANEVLDACIASNTIDPGEAPAPKWIIYSRTLARARTEWVGEALGSLGNDEEIRSVLDAANQEGFRWFLYQFENGSDNGVRWSEFTQLLQRVHYMDRNDLVGDLRKALFEAAQPDQQLKLIADIKAMAPTRHELVGLARLLADLWRAWSKANPEVVSVGTDGVLRVKPEMAIGHDQNHQISIRCSDSVTLLACRASIRSHLAAVGYEPVPELIYRTAWDVGVMQRSTTGLPFEQYPTSIRVPFSALRTQEGSVSTCWFGPPVRQLNFWERLVNSWNEVQADLIEHRSMDELQEFVDAFALRWIRAFPDNPSVLRSSQSGDIAGTSLPSIAQQVLRGGEGSWTPALLRQFANDAPGLSRARRDAILAAIAETSPVR